jgi:hypothetical protein
MKKAHKILVGKSKRKIPLGRPRRRLKKKKNIKMYFGQTGYESVD